MMDVLLVLWALAVGLVLGAVAEGMLLSAQFLRVRQAWLAREMAHQLAQKNLLYVIEQLSEAKGHYAAYEAISQAATRGPEFRGSRR